MIATEATQPRPFTGRRMLFTVLGFFGVVIGANVALALFAIDSWTGLVVENSYVASQHFNEDLARARKQQALGWTSTLGYAGGEIRLRLAGRNGEPLPGMTVQAVLRRPTHEGEDRTLALVATGTGSYTAAVALPAGTWNADVAATDRLGRHYQRTFRLWAAKEN